MFLNFFNNNDVFKKDSKKTPTRLGRKNFGMHIFNLFFLAIYGSFLPKPSFQKNEKSIKFHLPLFWMFSIFFSAVFDLSGIWSMVFRNDFFSRKYPTPGLLDQSALDRGRWEGRCVLNRVTYPHECPKIKKAQRSDQALKAADNNFLSFFHSCGEFSLGFQCTPRGQLG